MKTIYLLLLLGTLASCGGIKVAYDYDEQANFEMFKTYNYIQEMQAGMNQLDLNRLMKATDSILQNRGYTLSENPDLLIDVSSDQYEQASRNTLGIGVGSGGGNVGVGVGGGIPLGGRELHRTITINLVNAEKDALIWQAVSDSNVKLKANPQQRQAYFMKLMEKVFKKFPPQN
ncbi:DUF4136 domain-containing protein [Flavimarina sp. Hel_I_48]|uniref:DUF4136 domain-containing protein n=1 Tax=Flavimarina sp. Hel_I_48 TaxID=1392488 RepID=UPI0004DEDAC0|nr:DUF4136 domain-containing protein [Flavimarina sp. Hel_I_48]